MVSTPALILQHGADGPPARLGEWMTERGIPFLAHPVWLEPLPDPSEFAFVVSLGSARSAADTEPRWVGQEIDTLRAAVDAGVPVLGLCFGGQTLSLALGGGVKRLAEPEIGWIAVHGDDGEIAPGPWLQYHYEQLRVPPGAQELARSPAGPAAFRQGPHVGLQFHPEADGELVDRWARSDPVLERAGVTVEQLAAQSDAHAAAARERAFALFDRWLARAAR